MRWPDGEEFWLGANLPWQRYGGDFGANQWQPEGGVARPDRRATLRDTLASLVDSDARTVRWFMLADGRAGLLEQPDGRLVGLDDRVFRDADAALEELDRSGLPVILVLFDFHWFAPHRIVEGVRLGGRGAVATEPAARRRLLDRVVVPLLDRYGTRGTILAWEVVNEPEWVTRSAWSLSRRWRVPRPLMRSFVGEVVGVIHERASQPATVGSASARTLHLVQGLGLDLYQVHWYDHLDLRAPLDRPVSALGLDRPLLLGEFPTRGSRRTPAEIVRSARDAGYAGALAWSSLADDDASDGSALAAGLFDVAAHAAMNRARL